MPNTGRLAWSTSNSSRLRAYWRRTSRSASSAPRRSNLLITTISAKSSMSIFSSWLAAPNSGVITYIGTSTNGTIAASPWPMPGVSTITRSAPHALAATITSARHSGTSLAPRVASERKNTFGLSIAFIRMRSPSSAPPPRRRVGSMAITARRSLSAWSRRKRRSSSSVSDDLPEPPVPVMPSTGTVRSLRRSSSVRLVSPSSSLLIALASWRSEPASNPSTSTGSAGSGRSHSAIIRLIIPLRPSRWPSCGEKIRATPRSWSSSISLGTITPPPPPYTRMSGRPSSRRRSSR